MTEVTKKVPTIQYTEPQVAAWKAQFGEVFEARLGKIAIPVEGDTDGEPEEIVLYFKKPDIPTVSAAAKLEASDPVKSIQVMVKNCLLNKEYAWVADSPDLLLSLAPVLEPIKKARVVSLKKL